MKRACSMMAMIAILGLSAAPAVFAQGGPIPPAPPTYGPPAPRYAVTPEVSYFAGDGLGYEDGYLRLGLFAPAYQNPGLNVGFVDVRFLMDNFGDPGGSIGFGYREYLADWDRTAGGYMYFDTRSTDFASFQQLTFGLETLGTLWDSRVNVHLPVGNDRKAGNTINNPGDPFFQGNQILATGVLDFQQAMTGLDWRTNLNFSPLGYDVRPYAGLYYFTASEAKDTVGGRFGVLTAPTEWSYASFEVQTDNNFGTNAIFGLTLTYPVSRNARQPRLNNTSDRLPERVERLDWIVVDRQTELANITLGDPRNNTAWNVFHVSNNPDDVSDPSAPLGTFENPYTDFAQVRNNANGEELVYVRGGGGDGNSTPYSFMLPDDGQSTAIFTMNGGQLLYGAGINQTLPTTQLGDITLMAMQADNPIFEPGAGLAAVNMRNRTTVSGITVDGGQNGIIADTRNNLTIINNTFVDQSSRAIDLADISGGITIENNQIDNPGSDAVRIDNEGVSSQIVINNNIINGVGNGDEAYQIDLEDGVHSLVMDGNTIDGNGTGIRLRTFGSAEVDAVFSNNDIVSASNNQFPLQLVANGASQITFEAFGNTLEAGGGATGSAMLVQSASAAAGSSITGVIRDNPLFTAGGRGNALTIDITGPTVADLSVFNNVLQGGTSGGNNDAYPLLATAGGTSQLTLRVTDNDLIVRSTATQFSALVSSANSANLNLLVQNNDFERAVLFGGSTDGRMSLVQGGTSSFSVDFLGAGPNPGDPVVANDPFLQSINDNLSIINVGGTVLYQPGSTTP